MWPQMFDDSLENPRVFLRPGGVPLELVQKLLHFLLTENYFFTQLAYQKKDV